MYTLYGISNCNTVKKAKDWLTENNIEFQFQLFIHKQSVLTLVRSFEQHFLFTLYAVSRITMVRNRFTSYAVII